MKKKLRLGLNLAIVVVFLLLFFIKAPNINPLYPSGAFIWCMVVTAFIAVNFIVGLGGIRLAQEANGKTKIDLGNLKGFGKIAFYVVVGIWAAYFAVTALSIPVFNYGAYRDQLGASTEKATFTEDIQPIDISKLPIVDKALAARLADKKLGEKVSLGSQVNLGEPVIQQVKGELVWVVPLYHSGFFKWLNNMSGTPGYIVVSATDVQSVDYVEGHFIKYQPNNFFFDDLERHMRIAGAAFEGIIDYSFELNDEGRPYWVVTTYQNQWLFALPEATGVVLVDAETGAMEKHALADVPTWVDRVQPEEVIMSQITNQGEFVHGFLNFANKDKFKTSQGQIIVYNNGRCYLFTGLTSVGSDESALGFILVDMVTKESSIYYMSGATEAAAQSSAQGKVQQFGYTASFPMIINMDSKATYFMTLKDKGGLIKQYAFVSVTDYTTVGTGETVAEAKQNYAKVMRSSGNGLNINTGEKKKVKGTILRIASETLEQTVVYKMILEEEQDKIYVATFELSSELSLTQVGDSVSLSYAESETGVVQISEFDNLMFTQK